MIPPTTEPTPARQPTTVDADDTETGTPHTGFPVPLRQVVMAQLRAPWALAFWFVIIATTMVASLWLLAQLLDLVIMLVIATILATGMTPLTKRLQQAGLPRQLSVLLIYLGFVGMVAGLLLLIVPPVVGELQNALNNAPQLGDQLLAWYAQLRHQFPGLPAPGPNMNAFVAQLSQSVGAIAGHVVGVLQFAAGFVSVVFSIFVILLATFYLVVDGEHVRGYFLGFVHPPYRQWLARVMDQMGARMGGWFIGELVLMTVVGAASFVALSILQVNNALLLAVIAGIAEAIPIAGPYMSAVPAVLVAFVQNPVLALWVIGAYFVIQQLEGNVLAPKIMGEAVNLHPLAVIFSLLIGGALLGIVGAIIAVPLTAALAELLKEFRTPDGVAPPRVMREGPARRHATRLAGSVKQRLASVHSLRDATHRPPPE